MKYIIIIHIIITLLFLTVLASCVGEEPIDGYENQNYGLVFRVRTSNGASRASVEETDGSNNERRIDIDNNDYRIYLFVGPKGQPPKFMMNLSFNLTLRDPDYTEYIVMASIPYERFMEHGIDPDAENDYQLMMLANWNSLSGVYPEVGTFSYVSDIVDRKPEFVLTPNKSWTPFAGENKGIPMYGLVSFSAKRSQLVLPVSPGTPTTTNFYNVSTMYLLRAMTKVEIVDGRTDEEIAAAPYPRIKSVRIANAATKGLLIPDNFRNQMQVTAPTCPTSLTGGSIMPFTPFSEKEFALYGAEQYFAVLDGELQVEVAFSGGHTKTMSYKLSKLPNADGQFLRNHIYRYTVTGITEFGLELQLSVRDWDSNIVNWNYPENIGIAEGQALRWIEGTYDALSREEAYVVAKSDLTPLKCTFTLSEPKGAVWQAAIVSRQGDPRAFVFVDKDGNETETLSGVIDGTQTTFTIKPTNANPSQQNQGRLDITVTLPYGRTMRVDVLNGEYGENKFFTIIQNPSL